MSPMQREKALQALTTNVIRKGKIQSRRDLMRLLVAEGWAVSDDRTYGRIMQSPDGAFIQQNKLSKTALDYADFLVSKRNAPEVVDVGEGEVNLIKQVDDAYAFTQATDRFKEYIADTVAEPDYSMFATAKAMDEAAKDKGATISWDIEDAVMDSVLDDTQGPGLFDAVENDDEPDDEEGEDFDPEAEFDACPAMGEQPE